MSTEIVLKPKKRFSVGGLLCIFAAFAVLGFALLDILADTISVIQNLISFVQVLGFSDYIYSSQCYYLSNIIGAIGAILIELCLLVTVAALILYGALTLFKIKTRFLGVIFIAPAAASLLAILVMVLNYLAENAVWIFFDAFVAMSRLFLNLIYLGVAALPLVAMAICWMALAVVVLVFGGSKKYSKNKSIAAIIVAAVVALLFAGASAVGFGVVLLSNGMVLMAELTDMLLNGYMMPGSYIVTTLLSIIGDIIYAAVKYGALGLIYAVTTFFAVNWIVAPYKRDN